MKYALSAAPQRLPPAAPTAPQMFSVPRLSGGFDYYQAPPGSSPGQNNDYPVPVVAHPNDIGLASVHVGREMPPGCRHVGSGERAVGSITPMPGAGGDIPGLGPSELSLGALGGADGLGGIRNTLVKMGVLHDYPDPANPGHWSNGDIICGTRGLGEINANAAGLIAAEALYVGVPALALGAGIGALCGGEGKRGHGALMGALVGAVLAPLAIVVIGKYQL